MALATYSDLQTSIGNWLRRTDLSAVIPDFITLAEARINRELRLRAMETVVTGTTSGQTLTLPADLLEIQRLIVLSGSTEIELEYLTPKNTQEYSGSGGFPYGFTTINQLIYLYPNPDTSYSYSLFYIGKIPALSNTNTTNFLLTAAPDIYLYAALMEAAPYLKDDARLPLWQAAYANAIAHIQQQDENQQFPAASLVVRSDTQ